MKDTHHKPTSKNASRGERKNIRTRKTTESISNRPRSKRAPGQERLQYLQRKTARVHSGELSGDLQGLPEIEHLDSENLHELLEEGNAFEANVLAGVQDARTTRGRKSTHTRCRRMTCPVSMWMRSDAGSMS